MLFAISIFLSVVVVFYALFMLYVIWIWHRLPIPQNNIEHSHEGSEILIPVKNESKTIVDCVQSILASEKQIDTITVIDDDCSDQTIQIVKSELRHTDKTLCTNSEARGKKHALSLAIDHSNSDIILTTDGDCVVSEQWSKHMVAALQTADLSLGPVFIHNPTGFPGHFQQFDFIATMALSQVAQHRHWFHSGSATSMAYRREYISRLNPYADNIHIPSGDDIFLIEKIIQDGGKINFIKHSSSFVLTEAMPTWNKLWRQRCRWASKSKHYQNPSINIFWCGMGIVLFGFCLSIILFSSAETIIVLCVAWIIKALVDILLITRVVKFYQLQINYLYFVPSLFIYPFFIVGLGIRSFFQEADRW